MVSLQQTEGGAIMNGIKMFVRSFTDEGLPGVIIGIFLLGAMLAVFVGIFKAF